MMKNLYAFVILAACVLPARAETAVADTVVTELKEVVVKSERAWVEGDKIVFIPNKREKNLSNSPASLVQKMNIPMVLVDEGSDVIKSTTGKAVVVFINGKRAQDTDLATFWPKQAKRVEYMVNPKDPCYEGNEFVINFVMSEYEVGGVTRLNANQWLPNYGNYEAASKLVYRKMTYGFLFNGSHTRDHRTSSWGEDNYNGVYYSGERYDNIKREFDGHSWSRKDKISTSFNARYDSEKFSTTHTLSFYWSQNPGSGTVDADSWMPSLFAPAFAASETSGRSASPQMSGEYTYRFSPKWNFYGWWQYAYSDNDVNSKYQNGELEPIVNGSDSTSNSITVGLFPSYQINDKMTLRLHVLSGLGWLSTQYAGTADDKVSQRHSTTKASVSLYWSPKDNLTIAARLGVSANYWKVSGNSTYSRVEPTCDVSVDWGVSRRLYVSANLYYFVRTPGASQLDDLMIRQSDLVWLQGNPRMHISSTWNPMLSVTWLPVNWFRANVVGSYQREENPMIFQYSAATADKGGIIKKYVNGSSNDTYHLDVNLSASLFGNRLTLRLYPQYTYAKYYGQYAGDLSWLRMRGSVGYDLNSHCSFSVAYEGAEKYLDDGGMERSWFADAWSASFTYGNGNIFFRASVQDIFNSRKNSWTELRSDVFSSMHHSLSTGRCLRLMLTYTFGYGKKVNKGIDIQRPNEVQSGALGS